MAKKEKMYRIMGAREMSNCRIAKQLFHFLSDQSSNKMHKKFPSVLQIVSYKRLMI